MKKINIVFLLIIILGCSNPEKKNLDNVNLKEDKIERILIQKEIDVFTILDSIYSNKYTNEPDTVEIDTLRKFGINGFNLNGAKYLVNNYYTSSPYYDKVKIKLLIYESQEFAIEAFNEKLKLIPLQKHQKFAFESIWIKDGTFYIQFDNIILERLGRCSENQKSRFKEEDKIIKDITKAYEQVSEYAIRIPCGQSPKKITAHNKGFKLCQ